MDDISKKYQKMTQKEHLLQRPGMYMGSIYNAIEEVWVVEDNKMVRKNLLYNPGILKLFDEIIMNAADHAREHKVTEIKISVDKKGVISIYNDGPGIEIERHPEHKVFIPELIFSQFLTSSNYNDDEKRLKAGMNGLGAKITSTFSKIFTIETVRGNHLYSQTFKNNLDIIEPPKIVPTPDKDYTRITFYPDFKRFKVKGITAPTLSLLEKRAYDVAANTNKKVSVYFNDKLLKVKKFEDYIDLFLPEKYQKEKLVVETPRWKVAICTSPFEMFTQVSFVNGVHTMNGGTHVNYVMNPIVKHLTDKLQRKSKDVPIKSNFIKDSIMVFISALIENPEFKSQAKEELTLKTNVFGSTFKFDESHYKKIMKMELVTKIIETIKFRESKILNTSDGKKIIRLTGIPKLDDANNAGGRYSPECTLILTEGDSAKTFAISGLSVIGRTNYGVFPLKGKLLNVRTATTKQIANNEEIKNLKLILGLQNGKKFKNSEEMRKSMRYGKILILTDADTDGSHIKGLLINFFHYFWPELILDGDFITCLQTPIVKATKGKQLKIFYNIPEYQKWREKDGKGWKIKYYKGLGTSTAKEAKECFEDLVKKQVFYSSKEENDIESLKLAFEKEQADNRKGWIQEHTGKELFINNSKKNVSLYEFFDKEFVLFSIADCERSIPNIMDGLKPSQRKVLYGVLKKNTKQEIKVDQLRGFIGEQTAYHHGDTSLNQTIISMNHDFVGSNNLNLLLPCGQLGSRIQGGSDAASPRYISTKINPLTRIVFSPEDDKLLTYLDEDNFPIEPEYYWPCIPMILINGTVGIGTGYSTNIPPHNPLDIIDILLKLIDNPSHGIEKLVPWYRGFKGNIKVNKNGGFYTEGIYEKSGNSIHITELPIGSWTQDYKEFLEKIEEITIENNSTEVNVDFKIQGNRLLFQEWGDDLLEKLKLRTNVKSNLTVFDENRRLIVFATTEELLYHFYKVRLELYKKRYDYLLETYQSLIKEISARVLFIQRIISGEIKVFRVPKKEVEKQLKEQKFPLIDGDYTYLLDIKIHKFTEEEINKLEKELKDMQTLLEKHQKKTFKDLWKEDLNVLKKELSKLEGV